MTRISKTSGIDAPQNIDRTKAKSVKKRAKPTAQKTSKGDISKLKEKVRVLVSSKENPPEKLKEMIVREIISWQFGEAAMGNAQFLRAYDKLVKTTESSEIYQELIESVMKKAR